MGEPKVLKQSEIPTARKVWVNATTPNKQPGRLEVASLRHETNKPEWQSTGLLADGTEYFLYEKGEWNRDVFGGLRPARFGAAQLDTSLSLAGLGADMAANAGWKVGIKPLPGRRILWRIVAAAALLALATGCASAPPCQPGATKVLNSRCSSIPGCSGDRLTYKTCTDAQTWVTTDVRDCMCG